METSPKIRKNTVYHFANYMDMCVRCTLLFIAVMSTTFAFKRESC